MARAAVKDVYEPVPGEVEAAQFDGTNAADIKAWADEFDRNAVVVTETGLSVRSPTEVLAPAVVGNWLVASNLSVPQVWMVEAAEMAKKYRRKA